MIIHNQSKTQSFQRKSFKYAYFFRRSTWATQEMQSCRRGSLESEAFFGRSSPGEARRSRTSPGTRGGGDLGRHGLAGGSGAQQARTTRLDASWPQSAPRAFTRPGPAGLRTCRDTHLNVSRQPYCLLSSLAPATQKGRPARSARWYCAARPLFLCDCILGKSSNTESVLRSSRIAL